MNDFYYIERLIDTEDSNSINYNAGPMKISICCWKEEIKINCSEKWNYLIEKILITIEEAWNLKKEQIEVKNNEITIKFNFENLKLYIEHQIIYL